MDNASVTIYPVENYMSLKETEIIKFAFKWMDQ